jgi:hypothetical protein
MLIRLLLTEETGSLFIGSIVESIPLRTVKDVRDTATSRKARKSIELLEETGTPYETEKKIDCSR